MKMLIGSDPEWFLTNGKTPISVIGKVGGTKNKPKRIDELGEDFAIQEDNVALEYNTPPTDDVSYWADCHSRMHEYIKNLLKPMGLKPLIKGSVTFPDNELSDPRAWIFGCEPDFNAWTGKINPMPLSENPNLRSAGGHIHIGVKYNKLTKVQKLFLVRNMDLHVGLPLMILDPDQERQQLYGKAGAFRFKSYGVEYRTPSNFWTRTKRLTTNVAYASERAFMACFDNYKVPQDVQVVIDSHDVAGAKTLMEKYGISPIV